MGDTGGHIEPGETPMEAAKREWNAEVRTFDVLPENLTYPGITPTLFAQMRCYVECGDAGGCVRGL